MIPMVFVSFLELLHKFERKMLNDPTNKVFASFFHIQQKLTTTTRHLRMPIHCSVSPFSNTYVKIWCFFFFLKIKPTKFAIDVQVNRDIILQGIGVFLPYGSEIYGNVQIEGK